MNLHVFIGADDFLTAEAAKKVIGDGEGLETIDSANSGNEELRLADIRRVDESFSTPPFLEPRKVTWWRNVGFLPGGGKQGADDKVSEAVKEALVKLATKLAAAKLPENQHFVLTAPRLLKTSVFAKTLATAAEIVVFGGGKPWQEAQAAEARVVEMAEARGLSFAPGVSAKFIRLVGSDTRSLANELDKLRDYLGDEKRAVAAADLDAITSVGVGAEPVLWDVTDAIGARDAAAALAAMRRFELENGFEVFMSTVIEKFFRQLYDLKSALERGARPPADMNPYALKKNTAFLRNWTLAELRAARYRFLTLREKTVSGTAAGAVLVVTELVRTLRRRREAK